LQNAKKILKEIVWEKWIKLDKPKFSTDWLISYSSWEDKIIEWVFTWEEMLWTDGIKYSIPANYASKSKLVQWDRLKLTIKADWKMLYKQIKQIERITKIWLLAENEWKFQVIVDWKVYNLLKAAVTHFWWKIWDKLSIIIPSSKNATFAAIENVIPDKIKET
jgi:hypothetical protein